MPSCIHVINMKEKIDTNSNKDIIFKSSSCFFTATGAKSSVIMVTYVAHFAKILSRVKSAIFMTKLAIVSPNNMKYISINPKLLKIRMALMKKIEFLLNRMKPISYIDSGYPGSISLASI